MAQFQSLGTANAAPSTGPSSHDRGAHAENGRHKTAGEMVGEKKRASSGFDSSDGVGVEADSMGVRAELNGVLDALLKKQRRNEVDGEEELMDGNPGSWFGNNQGWTIVKCSLRKMRQSPSKKWGQEE